MLDYAGSRPESEALALRWAAVRWRTVLFRATKRGAPYERGTRLLAPLAEDLHAWREACGMPADDAPVTVNGRGEPWAGYDWDNWRSRTFRAAATAAGLHAGKDDGARRVRPGDLRSSFATLRIYEGQPPLYVAEQLGHSPRHAATRLRARLGGLRPRPTRQSEAQIERVRDRVGARDVDHASRPRQAPPRIAIVPGPWACSTGVPRRC